MVLAAAKVVVHIGMLQFVQKEFVFLWLFCEY